MAPLAFKGGSKAKSRPQSPEVGRLAQEQWKVDKVGGRLRVCASGQPNVVPPTQRGRSPAFLLRVRAVTHRHNGQ